MKTRAYVLVGLVSSVAVGATLLALPKQSSIPMAANPNNAPYLMVVTPYNLENGDFITKAGTRLHFNEDGVIEGSSIEIAPLGGLYLTTPINGLQNVELDVSDRSGYENPFTFAWCSAPYEAMDVYDGSASGTHDFTTNNPTDLPPRYFCITNPSNSKSIRINAIAIRYYCQSSYEGIVGTPLEPASSAYDNIDSTKTIDWNISAETAHVDFFDRGYIDYYSQRYPGTYPVAYTVYSASADHSFQYSKLASYTVKGMDDGNHAVTFHNAFEHTSGDVYGATDKQDYSGPFPEHWIWDAPINDFSNVTEDRDYYPVMTAFGFDPNGHCSPVNANWYLNEGHVEMPAPDRIDDGYQFVGWFLDPNFSIPYDPNLTYNHHITLFAQLVQSDYPVRPIHYYEIDREDVVRYLSKIDYVTLDQVSGDTRYGTHQVGTLYDNGFYYNFADEAGYCQTGDLLTVKDKAGPAVILTIDDTRIELHRDYHVKYRSETVTSDTFYTVTHFSDRKGYREIYDPLATRDTHLPPVLFHVKEDDTFKTIVSTDGYIYPYARRNTYLDDLDALTELGPYAYACYSASSAKPLYGLAGHNRVAKVGRRAFFNRFGMADNSTYFPANAKIFDTEAYANVFFNNNIVMLPNTLQKIGPRCFMGCQNLKRVYLPLSLASVGSNAFAVGTFDETLDQFTDIHNAKRLDFYYQGSQAQYNALPKATRQQIEANARSITYEVDLHLHAATDYFTQFDCPYTQKYLEEENL